jgi:hypothetical protein
MLQNSWDSKNVNLRSGDGAGSGLPKSARSHSTCLSSAFQKFVLICVLASSELQCVSHLVPSPTIWYLHTKFLHISTQKSVKLGCLLYANATFQEYNFSLTDVSQFYIFLITLEKWFSLFF